MATTTFDEHVGGSIKLGVLASEWTARCWWPVSSANAEPEVGLCKFVRDRDDCSEWRPTAFCLVSYAQHVAPA
jgi:hypothetical protein